MSAVTRREVARPTISELVEFALEYLSEGNFLGAAECFSDAAREARAKLLALGKNGCDRITGLIALYRHTARELDAVRGPGTARSEAIGLLIICGIFAILAIGVAAITGDA